MGTQTIVMAYPPIIPISIDVRGALAQMSDLTKQLSEKEINKATARAINRTLAHLVTKVSTEIPKVYALKKFQVKDRFVIKPASMFATKKGGGASGSYLTGKIESVSNRISASNFDQRIVKDGKSTKVTRSKKGGIGSKVGKGKGPNGLYIKIYKGGSAKRVASAFLMNKGGSLFYAFRGKYNKTDQYQKAEFSGRKVRGLLTQSVWDMAINKKVQQPTAQDGMNFFIKRFTAEANNLIRLKTQVP